LAVAAAEIARVLVPGGRAVFCEPWGENWLLRVARGRLNYRSKERTADEEPLRQRDLEVFRARFEEVEAEGYQFLSMVGRAIGKRRQFKVLERCDAFLLNRVPAFRRYCRYVVLKFALPLNAESIAARTTECCRHGAASSTSVSLSGKA